MSKISGKETKPEILVRKYLFTQGYRYRKNYNKLPGKPDIVLPKYKVVIFVHGCFWHGHKNCAKASIPNTNRESWQTKISNNRGRDLRTQRLLKKMGWKIFTIWQCELNNSLKEKKTLNKLLSQLNSGKHP